MDYLPDPRNPYGTPFSDTANYLDPAMNEDGKAIHDRTELEKGPLSGNPEEMGFPSSGDGQTTNATPPMPPGMLGGIGQGGPSWRGFNTGPPNPQQMGQQTPQGRMGGPSPQNGPVRQGYGGMGGDGAQAMPQGQFGPPPVNPDPWKKQQVAEAEAAMDHVRQNNALNPIQKNHALQKLNLKLNRLDPMRQYRRESPANSMTQIERYVGQNVHIFPEHGVALAVDGQGRPHWHTLPQQQQDKSQLEMTKFQHQQQMDLIKHQHQMELKAQDQARTQALKDQAQQLKESHQADQAADRKQAAREALVKHYQDVAHTQVHAETKAWNEGVRHRNKINQDVMNEGLPTGKHPQMLENPEKEWGLPTDEDVERRARDLLDRHDRFMNPAPPAPAKPQLPPGATQQDVTEHQLGLPP